jgi:RIP metalloprotease RseP
VVGIDHRVDGGGGAAVVAVKAGGEHIGDLCPRDATLEERADGDESWPTPHVPEAAAWIAGGAGSGPPRYTGARLVAMFAVIAASVYFFGPYALLMIAALLVSIILHEFGHYWTAKRSGMKVTEFFVGFGPRIWSFRRGETEYGIKAIPAGAYVRIVGMNNLEEVDPADEPRTYRAQSAPKRILVVLGGPFMNVLIAFTLMFLFLTLHGMQDVGWTVKEVSPGTAAAEIGLQPGDRVLRVDGEEVTNWVRFRDQLDAKAGKTVELVIERNGQQSTVSPTLRWRLSQEGAAAIPSTPSLRRSDSVLTANGQPVATYDELRALLQQPGDAVTLRIDRSTDLYELVVKRPVENMPDHGAGGFLGVKADLTYETESPLGAIGETGRIMKNALVQTGTTFGHLFTPDGLQNYAGQVVDSTQSPTNATAASQPGVLTPIGDSPAPELAGGNVGDGSRPISIVGIVHVGSQTAENGLWDLIFFVAMVNFALAMINLLPLLPFDGGHAVIGVYEGIRGLIRGERYQADLTKMLPIVYGVFALLVLLGTTSILIDILKPPSIK